ncbi:chromate resistance protein ChrB domain-containing protein [Undibacterium oligocarboniphilum]|uniref:Chromate resistance protein n=1 Tax=Undibacterium oligocarboniphilum TaxID=666702 RepID=A0A850QBT5_9BURK|nr:chromate resistance protein ChrB domain-containing protein [Undibacterium oligocarboniphilum]MBC3868748.1 chromate resistance protein [Undibacterium oligocarboniphilum]NVO76729.1 chromate resistance protein [Undibacterium oligocarboniphilum]
MNNWLSLITSLPTENATVRMRAWRVLKASGAAVLRDGVYLMPERETCRTTLNRLATDVRDGGGTALVLRIEEPADSYFIDLFDRSEDYATLLIDITKARDTMSTDTVQDTLKQTRKLRKTFGNLIEIDFFPGEAQRQVGAALQELELACARTLAPDEPQAIEGALSRLFIGDYQGRTWATRCRPWVDRLASAWLIRRFIDPQASLLWLDTPSNCPADALGFDFDGATFSHVGARVTFEVLVASFGLEQAALTRMGALVHYLDIGGLQPPEATGIESVLAGLREAITHDDQLLATASTVFDGLLTTFQLDTEPQTETQT